MKRLVNGVFCEACAVRPEIAYLETLKQKHWGKRDVWAWLFGLSGVAAVVPGIAAATAVTSTDWASAGWALLFFAYSIVGVSFWLRLRFARAGLAVLYTLLSLGLFSVAGVFALVSVLLPGLLIISALTNVRTKLFFKMEVPAQLLEREWRREYDNPLARSALSLGFGSFFFPFFAPVAVVTSVIALTRVNSTAQPPVGGRGRAIGGLILGLLGGLFWFGIYGYRFLLS